MPQPACYEYRKPPPAGKNGVVNGVHQIRDGCILYLDTSIKVVFGRTDPNMISYSAIAFTFGDIVIRYVHLFPCSRLGAEHHEKQVSPPGSKYGLPTCANGPPRIHPSRASLPE